MPISILISCCLRSAAHPCETLAANFVFAQGFWVGVFSFVRNGQIKKSICLRGSKHCFCILRASSYLSACEIHWKWNHRLASELNRPSDKTRDSGDSYSKIPSNGSHGTEQVVRWEENSVQRDSHKIEFMWPRWNRSGNTVCSYKNFVAAVFVARGFLWIDIFLSPSGPCRSFSNSSSEHMWTRYLRPLRHTPWIGYPTF